MDSVQLLLVEIALCLAFLAGVMIGFRWQPRRRRRRVRAQLRVAAAAARAELASNRRFYRANLRRRTRWGLSSRKEIAADRRQLLARARLRPR
jgi:uncharacterized membrane protein YhiD involved in acid resistance